MRNVFMIRNLRSLTASQTLGPKIQWTNARNGWLRCTEGHYLGKLCGRNRVFTPVAWSSRFAMAVADFRSESGTVTA